jgi:hypothetical protein
VRTTFIWSLIAIVLASVITVVFQSNALASLAVSTVSVEFCLGKAGIQWTNIRAGQRSLLLILQGAACGAALGIVVLVFTTRDLGLSAPEFSEVATGLFSALLLALRCELVEHAIVRHVVGPKAPRSLQLVLMVLATLAWTYGSTRAVDAHRLVQSCAIGCVSAALWQRHALTAIAARFAFTAFTTVVVRNIAQTSENTLSSSLLLLSAAIGIAIALLKTSPSPADADVAR